jgi:hypothetical protein
MLLLGLYSPCRASHSVCCIRYSPGLNLLTSAFIAPRLTIHRIISHPISLTSPSQQKAIPPATRSCLPPPPWPNCSQVTAACLHPPPLPSHRLPAGTTTITMTQATLTPLGLTTGKATGQAIGHGPTAILADPAMTQATFTPLGWIPGKEMGPLKKVKEAAAQASTIVRQMMARAHKAAAAAEKAEKDTQFKAYQQELGLLLNNDGEESAPSTPQKAAA